jgi:acid phosphatase type 7
MGSMGRSRRGWGAILACMLIAAACGGGPAAAAPPKCFGSTPTIVGTSGDEVLRGTTGRDVIVGLGGDDVLRGLQGNDLVCGGMGADTLWGARGDDSLDGGAGDDSCHLGSDGGTRRACDDPVILTAGDIACDPADPDYNAGAGTPTACQMGATSDILVAPNPNLVAVLMLGDAQYEEGSLADFAVYHATWGRVKSLTRPTPGNHEYETPDASGYFDYFGPAAGDPEKGYYSFDLAGWHIVSLNSQCWEVGGCEDGGPQDAWLARDLAAHPARCTLAFFHHPRFSSEASEPNDSVLTLWQTLYAARADLVLNGHNHNYERFAPQDPLGRADPNGLRQFVVGSGGVDHAPFQSPRANSQARNADTFGVLELVLHPDGYEWRFVAADVEGPTPTPDQAFTDAGAGSCS